MTKTKGQHSEAWHIEIRGRFLDGYGTQHIPSPPDTLREAFRAQVIFLIFGQAGFMFLSFLQKTMKSRSDFHCWIPSYCESSSLGCFLGRCENFRFWPYWLYFPFFFAKTRKIMSDFHCWIPVVKVAVWAAFRAEAKIFDFGQYWHYFPLLPQIIT